MASVFRAAVLDSSAYGARDAAMLGLFLCASVSAEDLVLLRYADYDSGTDALTLPGASRTVVLANENRVAMDRWLKLRGGVPGPLFNPVRRPNRVVIKGVGKGQLCTVISRRIEEAGVAPFTPDDVTRTRRFQDSGQWFGYRSRVSPPVPGHLLDLAALSRSRRIWIKSVQSSSALMSIPGV